MSARGVLGLAEADARSGAAVYWAARLARIGPGHAHRCGHGQCRLGAIGVAVGAGSIWVTDARNEQGRAPSTGHASVLQEHDVTNAFPRALPPAMTRLGRRAEGKGQLMPSAGHERGRGPRSLSASKPPPRRTGFRIGVWSRTTDRGRSAVSSRQQQGHGNDHGRRGSEGICSRPGRFGWPTWTPGTVTRIRPGHGQGHCQFAGGMFNEGLAAHGDQIWLAITRLVVWSRRSIRPRTASARASAPG